MVPTGSPRLPEQVDAPSMSFSLHLDEGSSCVSIAGDLESETVPVLAGVIAAQVARGRVLLWLDASRLTFFDLAGLDGLCAARDRLRAHGGCLLVVGASPLLRTVAELFGHGDLFGVPAELAPS